MPPKRPAPDTITTLMPPPPPSPTTPSSKRRRRTPSTTAPASMFLTMPLPPPYNPSLPNAPENPRPSDSQFTTFLYSVIPTLPEATQALYNSAMHNLRAENTPELTGEMRASLTSALTGFVLHVPTTEWWEGEGEGVFLARLARGEVPGSELVVWADTITAALRAFSGAGGSPAPSRPSSSVGSPARSPTPAELESPALAMPTRTPAATTTTPTNPRSIHGSRSSSNRPSALARDNHTCILTGIQPPYPLHVAHIIPFSVRDAKVDAFWGFLGVFLGSGGAERMRRVTLQLAEGGDEDGGAGGRDARERQGELANCMTLELRPHGLFDNGLIEMLPVPGSGNWTGDYDPSVVSSYDIRLSFPGLAMVLLDRVTYSSSVPPEVLSSTRLASGDTITLTTSDPARWPLPHPLLLQLHALCGRVKRLRAAAGWPVFPYGDGSEEGVGWREEVEGWDEDEEQVIEGRLEGNGGNLADGMVSSAGGVEGWVLGCAARTEAVTEQEEPGTGGKDRKRRFGAALGDEKEGGVAEDGERPRKVAVVMGEMGMREEERWGLVKGLRGLRGQVERREWGV